MACFKKASICSFYLKLDHFHGFHLVDIHRVQGKAEFVQALRSCHVDQLRTGDALESLPFGIRG